MLSSPSTHDHDTGATLSNSSQRSRINGRDRLAALLALIGGLALLVSMFFGTFLVLIIPVEMWHKSRAESWPSREAVIEVSYARRVHSARSGTRWLPEICVRYFDDGTTACIDRVRYGGIRFGSARRNTEAAVSRYPTGKKVSVHHDPSNRERTVLEARSPWFEMNASLAVALGMIGIPLVGILLAKKRRARTPG